MKKPILYGVLASAILLGLYLLTLSLVSGWDFARNQFADYWYFITGLSAGFGTQIALYQYIKSIVHGGEGLGKVVGVSGGTSTVAMISCCTHYLVNIIPIIGITGLASFVGQYQVELFWVGLVSNMLGIVYIALKIIKIKNQK